MLLLYNFVNIKLIMRKNNKKNFKISKKIKIKKSKLGGVIKHNIQTFFKNHLKSISFTLYELIYFVSRILECIYSLKYLKKIEF